MTKWALCISLLLFFASVPADAGEQIRRVQEELRKRHGYFGDIDGRLSKETVGALRGYQARKGLAATGTPDADTLRSLAIEAEVPEVAEGGLPDVAVLKSDFAPQLIESDRKLLQEAENNGPALPSVGEILPEEIAELAPENPEAPPSPTSSPEPSPVVTPEPPPIVTPEPPPVPSLAAQAEDFVRNYLDVCETNSLAGEMAFYADQVKYFEHGLVSRSFIERDVRGYYRRWPERDYELVDLKFGKTTPDEIEVKFRIKYRMKGSDHTASGRTLNIFTVRATENGLRFVSMREKRDLK